jgi:hypothetical protein
MLRGVGRRMRMPTSLTHPARGMRRRTTAKVRDEAMSVLEVDGSQRGDRTLQDDRRTAYPTSLGYLVMRFWNPDVLRNTDRRGA